MTMFIPPFFSILKTVKRESAGTPFSSPGNGGSNGAFSGMISKIAHNVSILRMGSLRKSPSSGGNSPVKRGRAGSFGESALHGVSPHAKAGVNGHANAHTLGANGAKRGGSGDPAQAKNQDTGDTAMFYSFPRDASRKLTREEMINQLKSKPLFNPQTVNHHSMSFDQGDSFYGGGAESLPPTPKYDSKSSVYGGGSGAVNDRAGAQSSASSILKAPSLGRLSRSSSFQHKKDQIRAIFGKGLASSSNFVKGLADSRRNEPEGFATDLFQVRNGGVCRYCQFVMHMTACYRMYFYSVICIDGRNRSAFSFPIVLLNL